MNQNQVKHAQSNEEVAAAIREVVSKAGIKPVNVFKEAEGIIYGDREETYGHPAKNLENIAEQWSLYMQQRFDAEFQLTAEDVCWMMADLKKCRQMNSHKRDNIVDAIGYIGLIQRIDDHEEEQLDEPQD